MDVTLLHGMTVIGAYIDRQGDAVAFSDSCVTNAKGDRALRHDGIKTIRLNSEWCLASAGHNWGSALLGAMLFKNSIIGPDTFAEIERQGLSRDDLVGKKALETISRILSDSDTKIYKLLGGCHVLLVGGNGENHGLWRWPSESEGWNEPDRYRITKGDSKLVIVAPDRISYMDIGVPVEEAVAKTLAYYAEKYPEYVDKKMALRRKSCDFALERTSS